MSALRKICHFFIGCFVFCWYLVTHDFFCNCFCDFEVPVIIAQPFSGNLTDFVSLGVIPPTVNKVKRFNLCILVKSKTQPCLYYECFFLFELRYPYACVYIYPKFIKELIRNCNIFKTMSDTLIKFLFRFFFSIKFSKTFPQGEILMLRSECSSFTTDHWTWKSISLILEHLFVPFLTCSKCVTLKDRATLLFSWKTKNIDVAFQFHVDFIALTNVIIIARYFRNLFCCLPCVPPRSITVKWLKQ